MFEDLLEFLWLYISGISILGLIYAGERFLNALPFFERDLKDKDTKLFTILAIIGSITAFVIPIIFLWDSEITLGTNIHWFSIIIILALGITLIARPLEEIPGYALILLTLPILIVTVIIFWFYNDQQLTILSIIDVPLWLPLIIVTFVMLVITFISYIVERTIVDPILQIIGNALITVIISILGLLHGLLLLLQPNNIAGLLELIQFLLA